MGSSSITRIFSAASDVVREAVVMGDCALHTILPHRSKQRNAPGCRSHRGATDERARIAKRLSGLEIIEAVGPTPA
jgi:hypothetical protein